MKIPTSLKNLIICLIAAISATLPATADNSRVSLLTCAPGEEIYELFGHTALRYRDSDRGIDIVFGYGYFSFEQPNFVWRFILGETDYLAGAVNYRDFIEEYRERGTGVTEQILQFTPEQKRELRNALFNDCRPQNSTYRYNYFYNNCTTKVRDRIMEQLPDSSSVTFPCDARATTIREAVAQHTASQPWSAFGINLLLGADVDKPATRHTLQFLPAYLMSDFAAAQRADGTPLISEESELLPNTEKEKTLNHFTPFNCALLLLLLTMIIMLCEVRSGKRVWIYDILLMLTQGVAGCLLLFMALFSQHPAVSDNYLIILLNPLPLFLIPFVVICAIKKRETPFMWAEVIIGGLFIATAPFVPQVYPAPVFIIAITIIVRSLFNIYRTRICELNLY